MDGGTGAFSKGVSIGGGIFLPSIPPTKLENQNI
jgi:hypothetical protein